MSFIELSKKMSEIGAKLILNSIKLIEDNKAVFIEQKESDATYAKKLKKMKLRSTGLRVQKKLLQRLMHSILIQDVGLNLKTKELKLLKQ